jgi:hypothetical protein
VRHGVGHISPLLDCIRTCLFMQYGLHMQLEYMRLVTCLRNDLYFPISL